MSKETDSFGADIRRGGKGLIMMTEDDVGIVSLKLAFIFGTLHTIYDHLLIVSSTLHYVSTLPINMCW